LPDQIRPVTEDTSELRAAVPSDYDYWAEKARNILSQKYGRNVSNGEAAYAVMREYVQRNDPEMKAKRVLDKKIKKTQQKAQKTVVAIPQTSRKPNASTKHQLIQKGGAQCAYMHPELGRCTNQRFLQIHHIQPVAHSGTNDLSNLTLLCSFHHRMVHKNELPGNKSRPTDML